MRQIILASASPRRQALLKLITPDFLIQVPDFDESALKAAGLPPEELVRALSRGKALAAREQFGDETGGPAQREAPIFVGGDTVVISPDGAVLGKPRDRQDAGRMLKSLSGRTHQVLTAVALVGPEKETSFTACTQVDFYPLTDGEIDAYLDTREPYDKAGGYGIQERGGLFVRAIRGDYFNVVGLPLAQLWRELKTF